MLLLSIPTLGIEPPPEVISAPAIKRHPALWKAPPSELTYDNILYFLEELENGSLEKRCSEDDLFAINVFMARLAEQGLLPNDDEAATELVADVDDLFREDYASFKYDTNREGFYEFHPAVDFGLSKAEIKQIGLRKAWKKTRKWCKKHKKALIIGTIVVAVAAVVVTVVVVSGGTAAAAGGAAGGGAAGGVINDRMNRDDKVAKEKPEEDKAPSELKKTEENKPQMATIIHERSEEMKTALQEASLVQGEDTEGLKEAGRVYGAVTSELAVADGAREAHNNSELAQEMRLDPSNAEEFSDKCQKMGEHIYDTFNLNSGKITPIKGAIAAGRVADRLPLPPGLPKVILNTAAAVGTATYVAIDPSGAQKAYDTVRDGVNYVYSQVWQTASDAKDYVTSSVSGWFEGFPDRPLPRDPRTDEPAGDIEGVPHAQLGTKDGGSGKYRQAREFDAEGKEIKRIDFTDHNRPQNHTNPHEHKIKPNETGGTPEIGDPEPVEGWNYGK